jgi:hypothetical protein
VASADPADLADALARWAAGSLVPTPARPEEVADVRHHLEAVAREAVARAGDADLASNPIRLSKGRLSDLLACERHLVATADERAAGGPGDEALHLGVLIDLLAEHHVVAGRAGLAPEPLALGLELCEAAGEEKAVTVAWVAALEGEARHAFEARLLEKQAGLLASWPAFDPRWWGRTQERASVGLADGDVVLSGRADVTVGGAPTPWPILVVEVKSGAFTIEQRDDGLIYALLLALRDGQAPAGAVTVTADGAVHVEAATADRLHTAAERLGAAILAAGELAGGRPPVARAGARCDRCPVSVGCPEGAARADARRREAER